MNRKREPTIDYDRSVPTLALKVGEYAVHHGQLGVVRSLGRVGVPVYTIVEGRWSPAGHSKFCAGRFVWPTSGEESYRDQLRDGLAEVVDRLGRRAVLLSTDDHGALFIAEHAEQLRPHFLFPDQPVDLVRRVIDKAAIFKWCQTCGIDAPKSDAVASPADLASIESGLSFPLVAKRCRPRLLADGSRTTSTQIIERVEQLRTLDVSSPILLQEFIPRDRSEDWLFHGYCDSRSECIVGITGRKLRSFPPRTGETAIGRAERNPTLEDQARKLLSKLGYRGAVSLDFRYDRRDGRYKLLDVNPRVGAIFRLFETERRIDVIRALHLDMTGRLPSSAGTSAVGAPIFGRTVAVEGHEARSAWRAVRGGRTSLVDVASTWRQVDQLTWFDHDDVVPGAIALARSTPGGRSRRRRRHRHQPPRFAFGRARIAADRFSTSRLARDLPGQASCLDRPSQ